MKLHATSEPLLPQETAARFVVMRQRYGRTLELALFGRRWILDLVR